jgi:queuine tRNA-ribosyltransferase
MLGPMLLTWHNLTYYQSLMRGLRLAIVEGRLQAHANAVRTGWQAAPQEPDLDLSQIPVAPDALPHHIA